MAQPSVKSKRLPSLISAACASALCLSTAFADDTEVFFGQVDPSLDIFPNVLFVLDTSGSMMEKDGTSQTRLDRMKDALGTILDNATNVNVGVMRFNGSNGGGAVLFPVTPIDKEICLQDQCGEISAAPKVSDSGSDAEESIADGNISVGGNDLAIGTVNSEARQVGLHFTDLRIPQGATITSAVLEFTSNSTQYPNANFNVFGELSSTALPFTNANADLSDRTPTNTTVNWPVTELWQQGLTYQSEQISSILQEIVNQDQWCGGNDLALMVTGTGSRSAQSFDQSPSAAPQLKVTYDSSNIPPGGGCVRKTHVSAIAGSSDDAEERVSNGRMSTTSTDLEMPYDRGNNQIIGLRFTDIKIPKGAIVTDASIEFEVDRQRGGNVSMYIQGHATGNPPTFGRNRRNISNRPRTGARVSWDNIPNLAVNEKISTSSLAPIAQELINRADWNSGNAMAFIFSRNSANNHREFETVDAEPVNAAKLRIEYQATADTSESTVITAREKLKEVVNGLTAIGGTPIVDAYFEASQYFSGRAVDYGRTRGTNNTNWTRYTAPYHRVSVPESYTGGQVNRDQRCTDRDLDSPYCRSETITGGAVYTTPFRSSCQTNHIVFLSDGQATTNSATAKVKALTGNANCELGPSSNPYRYAEQCGKELAEWLVDTDHSSSFTGKQNISTYTIGFNFSSDYLKSIATAGDGGYFQADSSAQLVDVFQSILGDVLSVDTSFVAPGATVNQFNRLTHRNDIYFALFKPDTRPVWQGNLKRYEVGTDESGEITINDVEGKPAVDVSSGFFAQESKSWWSDEVDGSQVSKGGAAAELYFSDTNPRKVYTYLGENEDITPLVGEDLTKTSNALSETNDSITLAHLGIENATGTDADRADHRESLLKWARGIDMQDDDEDNDTTDWRKHMGDPMHARPVILNYENGDTPSTTVFVGTNNGYLHAIERDEGKELFSYVPKELLDNFNVLWNNQSSDGHPYGLDGTLSVWHEDIDNNVTIDPGEQAYVYTGMRRGGNSYYALDVSEREKPKLAWVIDQSTPGFSELGQTWSKMTPAKVRYNGDVLDVLIFGAGYDDNQDLTYDTNNKRVARSEDSTGRGIYIVNAKTGAIIYSLLGSDRSAGAGGSQKFDKMTYSMPSDVRILDTNFDGIADQLYASDVGGQIWRFDFERYHTAGSTEPLIKGGIIADLNSTSMAGERRFYYEPDVAMISHEGERFLSISIGSGWRAHPLDLVVDDRFFMIKSPSVFKAPKGYGKTTDGGKTYTPITIADLSNATNQLDPVANDYGWMYDLDATGEKILGPSVTADNKVFFTSYRPALAVGACTTAIGGGSIYALNILNGAPILDLNGDGKIDEKDDEKQLAQGGIPPAPMPIITPEGVSVMTGPELTDPDIKGLTSRTFWADLEGEDNQD